MSESDGQAEREVLYKLTLAGNGITVDREVPEPVAAGIMSLIMGAAAPAFPAGAVPPGGGAQAFAPGTGGRQSLREYLDGINPKRNPDKITAIAGYFKSQSKTAFTREEVKDQFPKAGEPVPGNYPRDFSQTVSTGWIAERHDAPGSFYLTGKGEAAIGDGFSGKIRRPVKRKTKKNNSTDEAGGKAPEGSASEDDA